MILLDLALPSSVNQLSTEIVTKVVPMRAVNLLTGPFCTEFLCELLCDDDAFGIEVNFWDRGQK